ncbi:MAG: formimidoylglutamase [Paludibacteraceae bacterium]|nr:formimidoylglutamase [Paludibacteraceae bacterium]
MSVVDYFEKPAFPKISFPFLPLSDLFGNQLVGDSYDVAIIGVKSDSDSINKGCAAAPDEIRKYLYSLRGGLKRLRVADLGNIRCGNDSVEASFALRDVVAELRAARVIPVVIGGSQDLTVAVYDGLKENSAELNLTVLDSRLDLSVEEMAPVTPYSYLNTILHDEKRFRVDVVGSQSYYYSESQQALLQGNDCWDLRLGKLRVDLSEAEPIFRDSDLVSVDMAVVRQSDAPGNEMPSPNGLAGEELCQLVHYAGLSDRVQAFCLFEVNPYFDNNGQTASLSAQVIWHFLEALSNRYGDYPVRDISTYKKVVVTEMDSNDAVVFYNNHLNNRWWMEIPMNQGRKIFSCSYQDYCKAKSGHLSDLWMRYYRR